jgi:hypothetical protein
MNDEPSCEATIKNRKSTIVNKLAEPEKLEQSRDITKIVLRYGNFT